MPLSFQQLKNIIIKDEEFNPFSLSFNKNLVIALKETNETINEKAESFINFVLVSHESYLQLTEIIFNSFKNLLLSKEEIVHILFHYCNKEYIKSKFLITDNISKNKSPQDIEQTHFWEIQGPGGNYMNVLSIPEMQTDITAELLKMLSNWHQDSQDFTDRNKIEETSISVQIQKAWHAANIIINLRDQCLQLILFDNCYIEWHGEKTIKIKRELPTIDFIRTAAHIRNRQNIIETKVRLSQNEYQINDSKYLELSVLENGEVRVSITNKEKISPEFEGLATIIKYHASYLKVPIEYFDNLSITYLVRFFETIVIAFNHSSIFDFQYNETPKFTPTHFSKINLLCILKTIFEINDDTTEKIYNSLVADMHEPYFWKSPFYQLGDKIFFSAHALTSPNFNLYIEKWLEKLKFSTSLKRNLLKDNLIMETKNSDCKFQIEIIDPVESESNKSKFEDNVLILTRDNVLILSIVNFLYPIEYKEHNQVLKNLANAATLLKEKSSYLINKFDTKLTNKKVYSAVITEYPNYSGLIINDIPIIDISLLNNYFFVGKFYNAAYHFNEPQTIVSPIAVYDYYKDEDSFNENLNDFLLHPMPVTNILRNLTLTEATVLPPNLPLTVTIEETGHAGESKILESRTKELEDLMTYKYYIDLENKLSVTIDKKANYHLSILLNRICRTSYIPKEERTNLVTATMNAKEIGHTHLIFYLLNAVTNIKIKKNNKKDKFYLEKVETHVSFLFEKLKHHLNGDIALSDFEMPNIFNDRESRQLISMSIQIFDAYAYKQLNDDDIELLLLNLLILQGFRKKYELKKIFYTACSNLIDLLNQSNHFQKARDLCEEILHLSIKTYDHVHAWLLFFNCYTYQMNLNEAGIYGCLLFSALKTQTETPYEITINSIFTLMKFLRNFGYHEYAINLYTNVATLPITGLDKLKMAVVYFYTKFKDLQIDQSAITEFKLFLHKHEKIINRHGERTCIPWITLLLNLLRLENLGILSPQIDIQDFIDKLSKNIKQETLEQLKSRILGRDHNFKEDFINALLTAHETRNILDFVNEINQLTVLAYNVVQQSFKKNDPEGILLTSLVLSDQTLAYKNIDIVEERAPIIKQKNIELNSQFNNYQNYFTSNIKLKPDQIFIWLFEYDRDTGYLLISKDKFIKTKKLGPWLRSKLIPWTVNISNFHFNSKNLLAIDYDLSAQERDYNQLLNEFLSGDLLIDNSCNEIFVCTSVDLSAMPHNLLVNDQKFISEKKPITNVVSPQYFMENHADLFLPKQYKVNAWIPIEDGNMTINWGYNYLEPLLKKYDAKIYTKGIPENPLQGDINIFMAHGVRELTGFKVIKTTSDPHTSIIRPEVIFGKGSIAILFICNSGSLKDALYSKKVISFSTDLLKSGYKAVVSSFWPYDVTMSQRWLKSFLNAFDNGFKISEAVFIANTELADFDQETSTLFYAPAGRLSMHLYGNPNICIQKQNN